jgi:hypothetical protein
LSPPESVQPFQDWTWSFLEEDAWPRLARFIVDRNDLPHRATEPTAHGADRVSRRQTLERLWSLFADLRIPYQAPAWVAGGRQDIRDPHLVLDEGGTCLDLVLMFAAMAWSAGLRPYLVVDPARTEQSGHAVVAIDLDQSLENRSSLGIFPDGDQSPGWELAPYMNLRARVVDLERLVLLDCSHATAKPDSGAGAGVSIAGEPRGIRHLTEAIAKAAPFLTDLSTGSVPGWPADTLAVVDVVGALRARGWRPLRVDRSRRPAITSSLPEAPAWVAYPSRERLCDDILARSSPVRSGVVLFGRPGVGKSRLAHEVATRSGRTSAWWLTANDDRTLRRSLASANASESGRPLPETDLGRDDEAVLGLARLSENRNPWLVVLDNANCHPRELKACPRARAELGQRLIVTTLPEFAEAWAGFLGEGVGPGDAAQVGFDVNPLDDADLLAVGSTLSATARAAAAGSVLLVRAFEALGHAHPDDFESTLNAEDGDSAVRLWHVFQKLEPGSVDIATRAAWLPADGMPLALLGEGASRLVETGLLTRSLTRTSRYPLFDLHRTIGAAARATDSRPVERILVLLQESSCRDHLDRFGDSQVLDRMACVVLAAHRRQSNRPGLGPAFVSLAALLEAFGRVAQRKHEPDQGWSAEELLTNAQDLDDLSPLERADCLHGLARAVNQDTSRNGPKAVRHGETETGEELTAREAENRRRRTQVKEALVMIEQARELRRANPMLVARSEALRGLLMQKEARFLGDGLRTARLREAYDVLTVSLRDREKIIYEQRRAVNLPDDELDQDPELARAIFNLAGAANGLAAALPADDQGGRRRYLDQSGEVYERVRGLRLKIYGAARPHPHVLACVRGLGMNHYQRAWLLMSSAQEKLAELRTATEYLTQALSGDERLDYEDGDDTVKTLALMQKVVELRLHLSAKGDPGATHDRFVVESKKMLLDDQFAHS